MSRYGNYVEGDFNSEDVGGIIIEIRDWLGINQEGLAAAVGVKLTTLQEVEEGRTAHGYNILSKVAAKYDLDCVIKVNQK
jgi:DNA-binding XRE family transcriptional regulator